MFSRQYWGKPALPWTRANAAANGALHQQGVLVTRGDAIENLARATDIVFDKTGTLTTGALRLIGVVPLATGELKRSRDECLVLAARPGRADG